MPTEQPHPSMRTWLAGCTVHRAPPGGAPRAEVKVNGHPFEAVLDSGSAVSLVNLAVLSPTQILEHASPSRASMELLKRFDHLLLTASQPANPSGSRRRPQCVKGGRRRPVLLASNSARDGESPNDLNLFFDVFQQMSGGGDFSKAQHEDDRLKHCWA